MVKALALFSGGLDSTLAAKIILDEGVQVEGIHFANAFLAKRGQAPFLLQWRVANQLGIKLYILDIAKSHLQIVQKPSYGYGENMNPCIDCRILMFKQAKIYMRNHGFSFLVSGEVMGQRPMSQRRSAFNIIDRDARVRGLVLRPLSAKLLEPTIAEEKGWVDREKLFDFSGRTRKPQLALAKKMQITEYSSPAGGCLLTEAEFCRKLQDLVASGGFNLYNIQLLKVGRHFRLKGYTKIIVGRDEEENRRLLDLAGDTDVIFKMRDFTGPLTIVHCVKKASKGTCADEEGMAEPIETAAKLTARYSKGKNEEKVWVDYWSRNSNKRKSVLISPAREELVEKLRI